MKSYSSREIKAIIEANGWYVVNVEGDHWQFKHPSIKGRVTLTHPVKDVSITVMQDIKRKTGLNFKSCNLYKFIDIQRRHNMEKNFVTYPAILSYDISGEVGITFPDFPGCTGQCAEDYDIPSYALETLCFHLSGMIEDDEAIPDPSRIQDIRTEDTQAIMPVRVYIPLVREKLYSKAVTRTVTLPYWLDKEAKRQEINFSHELQNALMQKVGVVRPK